MMDHLAYLALILTRGADDRRMNATRLKKRKGSGTTQPTERAIARKGWLDETNYGSLSLNPLHQSRVQSRVLSDLSVHHRLVSVLDAGVLMTLRVIVLSSREAH
jgi:hypothetical protein